MDNLRQKPKTQKEQIGELWDVVIGKNGEGLNSRFDAFLETRADTCPVNAILKIKADIKRTWFKTFISASGWASAIIAIITLLTKLVGLW